MIDQELIDFFKIQIESKSFRSGVSVEDSYEEIKSDHIKFYCNQEDKLKAIDLAFIELKRQRSGIRSLKFASTISKKNQQEWYLSPDENIDLNWFAFKKYLSVSKSWSDEEINSVDESSTKVVNQILRFFKQGMAAKKLSSTGGGAAVGRSYFLGTPNVFRLQYRTQI